MLLLKALTMVDASAMTFGTSCVYFTFPCYTGDSIQLCYSSTVIGPSICVTTLPNGTNVTYYCGDLNKVTYTLEEEMEGMETSIEWGYYNATYPDEKEEVISETSVCNATANGQSCDTCIFCDDGSVAADCTNLELGTKVECGDIFFNTYVPYPFLFSFEWIMIMGSTCEVGPMADPKMSCPEGKFCQLTEGLCNNKMGIHTGSCAPIPFGCTFIYLPVW
jgi:hypothetical protein